MAWWTRREVLKASALAGSSAWGLASSAAWARGEAPPAPESGRETLRATQEDARIDLHVGKTLLTSYRADPAQKYPYLFPMAGPLSGLSLTAEKTEPYPHHASVFFACDRVNGGNYWQEGNARGQIVSIERKLGRQTPAGVEIVDSCEWRQPGKPPVMRDRRKIRVQLIPGGWRLFDFEIAWTAVVDATVEQTNHALFAIRSAADICPKGGGRLLSSEDGDCEKGTFGRPARWCTFYGKRRQSPRGVVEGIALFDHPTNPWKGCPWFTRDYGFASPSPFNFMKQAWQLAAGKSVVLRYGVLLYPGNPREGLVDRFYQRWVRA
jgi:hypothetical protein